MDEEVTVAKMRKSISHRKYGWFKLDERRKIIQAVNEYKARNERVNFKQIATDVFKGLRTAKSIRKFYTVFLDHDNGRMNWTKSKVDKLHELVEYQLKFSKEVDWTKIGELMEVPPFKCQRRYSLGPSNKHDVEVVTRSLSNEEKRKLQEAIESYKFDSDDIDFVEISSSVFGNTKSPSDLSRFYINHMRDGINRNPWSESEVAKLNEVVENWKSSNGAKRVPWMKLSKAVKGRTPRQCSSKYADLMLKKNK